MARTAALKKKILFFDTKPFDREFFDRANTSFHFEIQYLENHLNANTAKMTAGYPAVCAFVNDTLDDKVIETLQANGVGLVAMRCAGYNNVDLKAAYQKVHVVRVPGYSPHAVAEHAMALILSLNRKTHRAYYRTRDGNFSINSLLGFDLFGKTIGIVGTGKIGRCLITIAKGFGMKVLAFDKFPDRDYEKAEGISYVTLAQLYKQADIISLHCPLTAESYHMINEKTIAGMKPGIMIINTGRGKLIKTEALIAGLKKGIVSCAGLDVYEEEAEYFFEDFSASGISDDTLARLLTFPNVLVTSHQGFFTREALTNIAETTLRSIADYFQGKVLKNEICYRCGRDAGECLRKKGQRCF